jgi:glycosyltransferase involved in cell wall biosynthesis
MSEKPVIPVTLVLTVLNEAANLPMFFEGVRGGTVLPAEISISDGGSSDGTWEMLCQQNIPGVQLRLTRVPGANIAAGRNAAIRQASMGVLAITDAGCGLEAEWLERITAPLLGHEDVDVVAGGYGYAGDSFLQRAAIASSLPPERVREGEFLPSSRSFAVRASSIERAGLYPEHMTFAGEDTALCLHMRSLGMRFVHRLDARVHWYVRETMKGFLRQHFMYGLGDGEAHTHTRSYLLHIIRLLIPCSSLAAGLFWWPLALITPLYLFAYFLRLARVYHWRTQPFRLRIAAFGLIFLKITAMTIGWIRGLVLGPPGRKES